MVRSPRVNNAVFRKQLRSLLLTCVGSFALIRVRVSAGRGVASGDGGVGGGGTPWYQM